MHCTLCMCPLCMHVDRPPPRHPTYPLPPLDRLQGLSVVTTPMKCVTKLSHRTSGGGNTKANGDGEGEGEEWDGDDATANASSNGKRKRDDIEPLLEAQSQQLSQLQQTNTDILEQASRAPPRPLCPNHPATALPPAERHKRANPSPLPSLGSCVPSRSSSAPGHRPRTSRRSIERGELLHVLDIAGHKRADRGGAGGMPGAVSSRAINGREQCEAGTRAPAVSGSCPSCVCRRRWR